MTCDECEQMLPDYSQHTSGEGWMLRSSRAVLLQEHAQNCPACAAKISDAARLEDALDQLRDATMNMEAPASVEKTLLDAFRREADRNHSSGGRALPWGLVWLSAAVLVLAAAGILLFLKLGANSLTTLESNGKKVEIQPPISRHPSGAAEVFNGNRGAAAENSARNSGRHVMKTGNPIHESIPQPDSIALSDELSLNGGASIVRVTLPFSSLIAMGVPVRPELSETQVTADVWMDPFGAVVRVRLVTPKASVD